MMGGINRSLRDRPLIVCVYNNVSFWIWRLRAVEERGCVAMGRHEDVRFLC